jgi:outer membrane protein OmpA-like peptidoglycan-associated protein
MKTWTQRITTIGLAAALVCTTGCAAMQENPNTTKGVAYGTLAGAAAGAGLGALAGGGRGAAIGAGIGAGVGAVSGGLIGSYMDRQERELRSIMNEQRATNDRISRAEDSILMSLDSDTLFDTGSSTIYPGSKDRLVRIGQSLNRNERTDVMVVGNTDSVGGAEFNQRLSEDRARAVANALVNAGVDPARIRTRGDGESNPVANNATAEGRARNRRVEVFVQPNRDLRDEAGRAATDAVPLPPAA